MAYTSRLKLCIAMDVLIFIVAIIITNPWNNNDSAVGLGSLLFLLLGFIATQLYKDSGKCKKWRNLWKETSWMLALYAVMGFSVLLSLIEPENAYYKMAWILSFIANPLIRDIRNYMYAVKFDIDSYEDVNELVNSYPEAKQHISKEI